MCCLVDSPVKTPSRSLVWGRHHTESGVYLATQCTAILCHAMLCYTVSCYAVQCSAHLLASAKRRAQAGLSLVRFLVILLHTVSSLTI